MRPSKSKLSLERQCWKNEQYTPRECIEVVGIPDTTNETKVCDLIEVATSISITPDSLEANDKLIIKFSRRKDAEMVLSKKNKAKGFNPCSIGIESGKVFINESLCRYYTFLWSKCKTLWSEERIEAFWASNDQIKIIIEPKGAVSQITHITDLQKLFPSYDFQSK